MINEKSESKRTLVSIDTWRDDPSKVRIFIEDRDTIIIPKDYLYEMKRCIDTVLGEELECKNGCNSGYSESSGAYWCKECKTLMVQPLTEGEGECEKPECRARKAIFTKENPAMEEVIQNTKWKDYLKPQQESKEEEIDRLIEENKRKHSDLCTPTLCYFKCPNYQEPSKKPSTRISEIRKNITSGGSFKVWYGNDSLTAIVEYLDELHERKVI